ncbi:uncharacterized protein LOC111396521 [Olea europaea var. sylvestris]|uniref:uncharacterized protein LOC111396521 n=1 Tax=Olea europaea var. sylvestris TaxID=158386 RepID=UPI000C1D00BB|nr:uncharacterized protein LOC111396521 [Olea europaea var. sylvestris]
MKSWQNPFHDHNNFDTGIDTMMNPTILSPSFMVEGQQFCDEAADETEADNSQAGNLNGNDSMGYLKILSSDHDNPNDTSMGEETEIIVSTVGMKFKDELGGAWCKNTFHLEHNHITSPSRSSQAQSQNKSIQIKGILMQSQNQHM